MNHIACHADSAARVNKKKKAGGADDADGLADHVSSKKRRAAASKEIVMVGWPALLPDKNDRRANTKTKHDRGILEPVIGMTYSVQLFDDGDNIAAVDARSA